MQEVNVNSKIGHIQIANEVLAIISRTAALEVEGVVFGQHATAAEAHARLTKRNFARGVKATVEGDVVSIDIAIFVKFGHKIHQVSEKVQERVKTALETMVGMTVTEVNVNVVGVQFEKLPKIKPVPRTRG
ncbi:MAG: Asp23/Gls24 family envelope stress response protein [Defluviitaleaceae bacterium]|nr:Asp23/Gls24 family envelope stress response protein [Defluviitaleaceae bacterium]